MAKLYYGSQRQVAFANFNEYYFALGFLANSNNAELRWENNEDQGAWGSEGRIHCLVPETRFPQFFRFTAGRGNVYARINCNEYVATLVREHNFKHNSKRQDVEAIMKTVPLEYRKAFQDGYGCKLSYNPTYQNSATSTRYTTNNGFNAPKKSEPAVPVKQPVVRDTYTAPDVKVGSVVIHKTFGEGTVTKIDKTQKHIHILFGRDEKTFVFPDAFKMSFLKMKGE